MKILNLNWKNYQILNELIKSNDPNCFLNGLTLLSWTYFGLDIYYGFENDKLFLWCYKKQNDNNHLIMYRPILKFNNDLLKSIDYLYNFIIKNQNFSINNVLVDLMNDNDIVPNNWELLDEYNLNYISLCSDLKTFSGRKMQKKRNHLLYFIKNYESNVKILIFDKNNKNHISLISNFIIYNNEINNKMWLNEIEPKIFANFLINEIDIKAIILLNQNNQVIGFSAGVIIEQNDIFEVFLEKANKDYRGIFQYLIYKNLNLNNICARYVDRQDDNADPNLAKAKLSYHPTIITPRKRYKYVK